MRLIDGTGASPVERATVIVRGETIEAAGPADRVPVPEGAAIHRLAGATVLPGLIDLHVHLRSGASDRLRLGAGAVPSHLDMALPLIGIKGYARARRALRMGITTLRDVGDVGHLGVSLRDAIEDGIVEGPRIVACGQNLTATGGAADYIPDWLERVDVEGRVTDSVDGVRKAVRRQIKNRVDWIKFFATGTFGDGGEQDFTDEEIQAMVDEAHARGRKVCAHCCFARGTRTAVRAGVDSVEHGSDLTDEIAGAMAERGTVLVPTISVFHGIAHEGREAGLADSLVETGKSILDRHVRSFRTAMAAGVTIAMGSDCGNAVTPHGTNARELALMVRYGMKPMDAILASTRTAAALLNRNDSLGTVEPGKLADLIVVDGDPLDDIAVLQDPARILLVLRSGAIHADRTANGSKP